MTRIGKIARLPREIREELNCRLYDGEQGTELVSWLNSLPEVNAVMEKYFNDDCIRPQNLSEWKTGGYRDWLLQQETTELACRMQADSDELSQTASTPLTDLVARRLTARYALSAERLSQSTGDGLPEAKLLRELCADIIALRKGDQQAERLRLERDRLNLERDTRDIEKLARKWAEENNLEIQPKQPKPPVKK